MTTLHALQPVLGLLLIVLGIWLVRTVFVAHRRTHALPAIPAVQEPDPAVEWRKERREWRRRELNDWDQRYRALLPPEPPCTSTDHDHDEIRTYGGQVVARICHEQDHT